VTLSDGIALFTLTLRDLRAGLLAPGAGPRDREKELREPLSTLQRLFDAVVRTHSEMTVLGPMNGTFLAVGGVFNEGTQLHVNARQAVSTGIDGIEAIEGHNRNTGAGVRARLGMVNGQRIIASTAWTTASRLGQTGEPMTVVISQKIYELVYVGQFVIREGPKCVVGETTGNTFITKEETVDRPPVKFISYVMTKCRSLCH
jgi:hypothetical protein